LHLQFTLQLVQSVNHCNIYTNFVAVGTHYEVYLESLLFQPNLYSHRDLVLYCGLRSTPDELVQVDVMQLAVHFFWSHSPFSRYIRKSSWNYRSQCIITPLCQVL